MSLQDEVYKLLRVRGPLDDDEIATLLGRNRHYVNQVCRNLVSKGRAHRAAGPDGKLVTVVSEADNGSAPTPRTVGERDRLTRTPRAARARQNMEDLVNGFDQHVRRFEASNTFPGPSLYFHERAIERRRQFASVEELLASRGFFELVYAVLPAWGMHRMGAQAAKVGPFDEMVNSFLQQEDRLRRLFDLRIAEIVADERGSLAEELWSVISGLKVSTSGTRIVAGSKALHHVLPDLVPPIDRQYTFRFFTGQKALTIGERRAFLEWFPLFCEIADRRSASIQEALDRGGFMATGEAKIIDNAIIGFMQA